MRKFNLSTLAVTSMLAFAPFAAHAYTGACSVETTAVKTAVNSASYLGNKAASDKANLLAKVDAAEAKLTLRKYDDAVDKLLDVAATSKALADAPKEKMTDASAAAIATAVSAAIVCIGGL